MVPPLLVLKERQGIQSQISNASSHLVLGSSIVEGIPGKARLKDCPVAEQRTRCSTFTCLTIHNPPSFSYTGAPSYQWICCDCSHLQFSVTQFPTKNTPHASSAHYLPLSTLTSITNQSNLLLLQEERDKQAGSLYARRASQNVPQPPTYWKLLFRSSCVIAIVMCNKTQRIGYPKVI